MSEAESDYDTPEGLYHELDGLRVMLAIRERELAVAEGARVLAVGLAEIAEARIAELEAEGQAYIRDAEAWAERVAKIAVLVDTLIAAGDALAAWVDPDATELLAAWTRAKGGQTGAGGDT